MLIITELRNVHERDESRVCLRHWRKMIFLTSAVLRSLSLSSFSKTIVSQEIWTSPAMIRENNKFFHEEIIKSYISMVIERLVNAFNEFVKRIKRTDMTVFDINVYWNVTPNTPVASSSTFKSFMLTSSFAAFRSPEELDVDTRMRSQNAERFKRIAGSWEVKSWEVSCWVIVRSAHGGLKKEAMTLMISEARLSVRDDCSNWLHDIVAVVYNDQETIINWGEDVCHEVNPALLMLFLRFLYWTSVSFRSFIYTSASIAFRP